jgi:hypothetical protein
MRELQSRWEILAFACVTTLCVASPSSAQTAETPADSGADIDADAEALSAEEEAEIAAALEDDAPHCRGTGIEGVVRDAQTHETMIEAPVVVVGRGSRTMTDYDGRFAFDLPPGTYTLRSYYDLYEPARIENVVVRSGNCTQADIELGVDTATGEEVVIEVRAESGSSASQLRARRESAATQDAISSEEMSRTPDASASDAARRVVGVSVRDDYLFVRGLGGRYVVTTMNGVLLPSTDPDVPGVQLDTFPTGLLESITVRKTFTPEVQGDWAGGLMDITTQDFPTRFQVRAAITLGMNTLTSFQTFISGTSGGLDWLGFDDGTRALPAGAPRGSSVMGLPGAERDALSLQFRNDWALGRHTALPNMSLVLSIGDTLDVGGHLLGYRLMVGYRYAERPIPDVIRALHIETDSTGNRVVTPRETLSQGGDQVNTTLSALGTLTYEIADGHRITFNGLFSQNSEDFVGRITGQSENTGSGIDGYRSSFVQRTLLFGQLLGTHEQILGGARFDWQLNLSHGEREQPDMHDLTYAVSPAGTSTFSGTATRFWSGLDDLTVGGGGNLTIPIDQLTVRIGGLVRYTDRSFDVRRLGWSGRGGADPSGALLPPDQLFAPDNLNTFLRLRELTRPDDSYDAQQSAFGAYGMLEWHPVRELRFVGGTRVEAFRQVVVSADPLGVNTGSSPSTRRTDIDPMPSVGAIAEIYPDMFLRASYAGTVARPQLRELAPFLFNDFVRRRNISGNPDLQRTYIHNFDVRWEWFPSSSEVLAVSGFAKVFESPIESTLVDDDGNVTFRNINGAENYGVEVEARFHFGHLAPELDWISLGGNFAYIYSQARLSEAQRATATSAQRPLAGQAPYAINVSLGLAPPGTNVTFNAYYNVFGPRLEDVGQGGLPDIYREPFHSVDVAIAWSPIPELSLRLTGQNVLFQRQELQQAGYVVLGLNPGTVFSLGVSVSN